MGNVRKSVAGDPAPLLGAPDNSIPDFNVGTVVNVNIRIIITRLSGFFSLGIILPVLVRLSPLPPCLHVLHNCDFTRWGELSTCLHVVLKLRLRSRGRAVHMPCMRSRGYGFPPWGELTTCTHVIQRLRLSSLEVPPEVTA